MNIVTWIIISSFIINQQRVIITQMRPIRNTPQFTHFACLPFIRQEYRHIILDIQNKIKNIFGKYYDRNNLMDSNHNLAHLTLSMLTLHRADMRQKAYQTMETIKKQIFALMINTDFSFKKVGYFTKYNAKTKKRQVNVIYLQIEQDNQYQKLLELEDLYIKAMMKSEVIFRQDLKQMFIKYDHNDGHFKNDQFHLTLFRVKNVLDDYQFQSAFKEIMPIIKPISMHCDMVDISTRGQYDNTSFYEPYYRVNLLEPTQTKESNYVKEHSKEKQPSYVREPSKGKQQSYLKQPIKEKELSYLKQSIYGKEPSYIKESNYGKQPSYIKEPSYRKKFSYIEETDYTKGSNYGMAFSYVKEPSYIKDSSNIKTSGHEKKYR